MHHVPSSRADTPGIPADPLVSVRWRQQRLLATSLLLLAAVIPASAGSVEKSLTLARALEFAHKHNPELRAAQEALEIARGRLVKAEYPSQFNPEVSGEGAWRDLGEGGSGADYGVMLSQELEVAGQRGKRIAEAHANIETVEARIRNQTRLIDAKMKLTFFAALAHRQRRDLLRRVEELNRRVRDASKARVEAGESPVMELNLAEIRFGQSRKETIVAERDYAAELLGLKRLLNLAPEHAIDPRGELRAVPVSYDLAKLVARATAARPDLLAKRREVGQVDAETALTRRLAVPNPTLEVFYREEPGVEGAEHIVGGGVRVPLPIFDRQQAELVALAGRRQRAQFEVDATVRTVEGEVAEALQDYEAARGEVEIFEHGVLARADENYHFIEIAYRAGKIDFFQFVVVQNDLVGAQLSYVASLAAFRAAEVNLERAVGAPL
jgi:cobalt-zinc-cadmium efflux system outer membrane protein